MPAAMAARSASDSNLRLKHITLRVRAHCATRQREPVIAGRETKAGASHHAMRRSRKPIVRAMARSNAASNVWPSPSYQVRTADTPARFMPR